MAVESDPSNLYVKLNDVSLNVYHWKGESPPLLFVHATGFHARVWNQVIARLGTVQAYAVDQRCHGLSDNTPPPYSWELFGNDLVNLVKALDLHDIIAIGHSMGGHVVLHAAALLPDRFKKLLVLDPVVFAPHWNDPGETQGSENPVAFRKNNWQSAQEMYERFCTKLPFCEWDQQVLLDYCTHGLIPSAHGEHLELACPPHCEAGIYQSTGNFLLHQKLGRISAPVRILRARERTPEDHPNDFRPSATWDQLVNKIPNASECYLPSHSHFIPMEDPQRVADEVKALLAQTF